MIDAVLIVNHIKPVKEFFSDWVKDFILKETETTPLSINSSVFKERRSARSLLSKYAATAPFLLLRKEGVFVSAMYNEEINDESQMLKIYNKKLEEAKTAIINDVIDDGSYFNY